MSESNSFDRAQNCQALLLKVVIPHDVAQNLDTALQLAESQSSIDTAAQRPQEVRDALKNQLGISQLNRLAYRPQPAPSQASVFESSGDG
jgi:hypothetical protein